MCYMASKNKDKGGGNIPNHIFNNYSQQYNQILCFNLIDADAFHETMLQWKYEPLNTCQRHVIYHTRVERLLHVSAFQ